MRRNDSATIVASFSATAASVASGALPRWRSYLIDVEEVEKMAREED